ncbi:hypothetical protein DL93DRAFT_2080214, partial [Clavulina sp. PMI_390]
MDFRESEYDIMSFLEHLADPNPHERNTFVESLPKLKEDLFNTPEHRDDRCPICQETFLSCLALEEMAYAMDSPALSPYEHGVTKLSTCGHIFCRKDISKWIISARKDTCPTCRTPIGLPPRSSSDSSSPLPTSGTPSTRSGPRSQNGTSPAPAFPTVEGDFVNFNIPGMGRQQQAELMAQLTAQLRGEGGNMGESPYQYDDDRSEFAGMY